MLVVSVVALLVSLASVALTASRSDTTVSRLVLDEWAGVLLVAGMLTVANAFSVSGTATVFGAATGEDHTTLRELVRDRLGSWRRWRRARLVQRLAVVAFLIRLLYWSGDTIGAVNAARAAWRWLSRLL
jgi:hypothetical protein